MATVGLGDIVRVVNRGDTIVPIMYDSRTYRLEPGRDSFIPFEAAVLWFGDPRASSQVQSLVNEQGLRSFVPDRDTEVRRLRVKYNNWAGDEASVENAPVVEVFTLEGERVYTVLDDPSGDSVIPAETTVSEQQVLLDIVNKQQQQINFLLSRTNLSESTASTITTPESGLGEQSSSEPPAPSSDSEPVSESELPEDDSGSPVSALSSPPGDVFQGESQPPAEPFPEPSESDISSQSPES